MKANFFEFEYNPKIDYLITKNLLFNWPGNFNEFQLRKAYKKHIGHVNKKLKVLQNIRDFLSKKKIIRFTKNDYEKLIYIRNKFT